MAQIGGGAATYYVSKSGSDSNAGTSTNAAFLMISKAASLMNAGDTCYVLSGTYRETVTPAHSGTSSAPITFAAYPGAIPIVSGADVLNLSWGVYSGSIYQAGTTNTVNQLFVDGTMMNIARWPNAVTNDLLYAPRSTPTSVSLANITDTKLPSGLNLVGAYVQFFDSEYGNQGFTAETREITSWNASTKTFSWANNVTEADSTGVLYYVYGTLSLLDIPTEWYESSGGTLYLWAPDSASPATHLVETKNRTSAFTLDNHSYVVVNGIYVFAAGISMANTTDCVVNNCNLVYVQHNMTADWAKDVPIANQVSGSGSRWENSTIQFSSQDGIRCSGQNEVVSNCIILDVDYYPGTYYAGVSPHSGGSGTTVVNNTIWYSGRYCVGISSIDVNVCSNDLAYGELLTSDGGGTYEYTSPGNGKGTQIHHNWVHNCWAGVYIDSAQSNYFAYRNVCYSNYAGMLFNQFNNNLIINNTTVSNTIDILDNGSGDTDVQLINNLWHTTQNTLDSGTTVTDSGWYPPLSPQYVPETGSGAINGGEVYSPYTDGYVGSAPDIGAYEVGGAYWVPGANFAFQPFPSTNSPPIITTQPVSQSLYIGGTAAFSVVTATSFTPLSYQWRGGTHNSGVFTNLVAGGGQYSAVTNAAFSIANLVAGNEGDYEVAVSNGSGSVTSMVATLTILSQGPSISTQPQSQTVTVGTTATFDVSVTGLSPLYYQWSAGETNSGIFTNLAAGGGQYSSVTNATFYITNVTTGNAGDYQVVVSNAYGSVTSFVAILSVITVPVYQTTILDDHPTSYWPMHETNGPIIHDVVGTNNGTMFTGTAVTGTTNDGSAFTMGGPGFLFGVSDDTAIYFSNETNAQVEVPYSSLLDTATWSAEGWFNIPSYPISYNPSVYGVPLEFSANNSPGQGGWQFDVVGNQYGFNDTDGTVQGWAAKSGGAGWTQLAPTSADNFSGNWVYCVMTYDGTTLKLYEQGNLILSQAAGYQTVADEGLPQPLIMGATVNNATALNNWFLGGMEEVAMYNYPLSASQVLNHYDIGVYGPVVPASISTEPAAGFTNYVDYTPAALSVAAGGTAPLYYQWYKNSEAISGATSSSLALTHLQVSDSGTYYVTVSNSLASATSSNAVGLVLPLPTNAYQATVISEFPEAYYPMDETNGTEAYDVIGTGDNNGEYLDGFTLGVPGPGGSDLGTAVAFDGASGYVNIVDQTVMQITGNITLEAWALIQDTNDDQIIVEHGPYLIANPSDISDELGIMNTNGQGCYYIGKAVEAYLLTDAGSYTNGGYTGGYMEFVTNAACYPIAASDMGQWVHLVGVADGPLWRLYKNGVELTNSTAVMSDLSGEGAGGANGGWAIGAGNNYFSDSTTGAYFYGSINNVAIYDYALTPGMIAQQYELGTVGHGSDTTPASLTVQAAVVSGASGVTVNWNYGYLQEATSINGPWTYVSGATSPYTIALTNSAPALFFRSTLLPSGSPGTP